MASTLTPPRRAPTTIRLLTREMRAGLVPAETCERCADIWSQPPGSRPPDRAVTSVH